MGTLFNMLMRVAIWGGIAGAAFYGATVFFQAFFKGGALNHALSGDEALRAGIIGIVIGSIVGFFKKG